MSTHKYFDKICCVILAFTLVLTVVFMNAESFGIIKASTIMGYENRLFDWGKVHTINIVMDDWDEFLDSCTNEEYADCAVIIDNEAYKNVAIRAKGNTSLSNVQSYGNDRYSFKIEFDHYDSTNTYYGLDKLSLNNIIQDNTYMKDFLTYQMMGYFGVSAPLCSYVQILVNGEEWGLYLAVEGVEESFLQRNYGNNYGELYKPDSTDMGGGRGNGGKFDMDKWQEDLENEDESTSSQNDQENLQMPSKQQENQITDEQSNIQTPDGMSGQQGGQMQPENIEITIEQIRNMVTSLNDEATTSIAEILGYDNKDAMLSALETATDLDSFLNGKNVMDIISSLRGQGGMNPPNINGDMQQPSMNGGGGMGGMGSSDVSLIYSDDNYDSYSNIFNNAKTDIDDTDKERLISSLKQLNENSSIEDIINVEEVIRYFVVHNFVCNFDSYTGSMIHNYYLYEEDGQLSMIPWDYNLAFGGFVGGSDATSLVNYPIDSPVSGGTIESRPMLSWIFESEEYTEIYHQYFEEFISEYFDSGYFANMIDEVKNMISPYVESDPTKFCTYDEFEKGIDTLKDFCLLRAQSVGAQLDGTIASTSDAQDKDTLIDASAISISNMGSMGGGMGGGIQKPNDNQSDQTPDIQHPDGNQSGQTPDMQQPDGNNGEQNGSMPQIPKNNGPGEMTQPPNMGGENGEMQPPQNGGQMTNNQENGQGFPPGNNSGMTRPDNLGTQSENVPNNGSENSYILLGICGGVLLLGLLLAIFYKKRV